MTWHRRRPRGSIGSGATSVLLAVISLSQQETTVTIREVQAVTGFARGTVQSHLTHLRAAGLVDWVDNLSGTLRPTVGIVKAYA